MTQEKAMVATNDNGTVIAATPEDGRAPASASPPEAQSRILDRLLRMADGYLAASAFHQAEEMYLELAADYPRTAQGERARARLFELCEQYEKGCKLHQARSLFERLL